MFLDDETFRSEWVALEVQTAHEENIPIVVVVDQDRFVERALIDQTNDAGFGYIFGNQVRRLLLSTKTKVITYISFSVSVTPPK